MRPQPQPPFLYGGLRLVGHHIHSVTNKDELRIMSTFTGTKGAPQREPDNGHLEIPAKKGSKDFFINILDRRIHESYPGQLVIWPRLHRHAAAS